MTGKYRRYTVTSRDTLVVGFKCAQCGKKQVFSESISASSVTTDNLAFTNKAVDRRIASAREDAQIDLSNKIKIIRNDISHKKYRSLNTSCKCKYCGLQPLWSEIHSARLFMAKVWMGLAEVILAVVWIFAAVFGKDQSIILYLLLTGLALLVLFVLIDEFLCRKRERQIEQLDDAFLPVIIEDEETFASFSEE